MTGPGQCPPSFGCPGGIGAQAQAAPQPTTTTTFPPICGGVTHNATVCTIATTCTQIATCPGGPAQALVPHCYTVANCGNTYATVCTMSPQCTKHPAIPDENQGAQAQAVSALRPSICCTHAHEVCIAAAPQAQWTLPNTTCGIGPVTTTDPGTTPQLANANITVAAVCTQIGCPQITLVTYSGCITKGTHKFWRVYALDQQGNAFVEKNGEVRQLLPNSYEYVKEGETKLQTNSMVHIKRQKEHRDLQPTFYHLNSEELMPLGEEIGRFYWNIEPEGAKYLVEHVSEIFNRYKVPFMFKCTNHPDLYSRTDGAVLYILRKQYRIASRLVRLVVQKMKPYLKSEVPLFTRKLTNGLSYAEDPGMNQSFGMSRSELIAKGIVNAYSQRRNNKTAQYKEILKAFKENGLDYKQPYLRANSHWSYDFDFLK